MSQDQSPQVPSQAASATQVKWFQQKWFVILMTIFVFPVGLALLWTSPVTKKSGRIIWTALVALGLVIYLGGRSGEPTSSAGDSAQAPSATAGKSSNKAKDEYNLTVTDKASGAVLKGKMVSNVGFAVLKVDTAKSIGDAMFAEKASNGATFVLVKIYVTNDQKDAITLDGSLFKLLADGKEYDYSIEGSTALEMSDKTDSLFLKQLNPGLNMVGIVPFEVPEGIDLVKAQLQVQGGMTGRTATLPLRPVQE